MAKRRDTTNSSSIRARSRKVTQSPRETAGTCDGSNAQSTHPPPDLLKQAIDTERAQLMRAQAVIKTLSAALMNSEDDDAMFYVDAANVAMRLIDEAVGALDRIRMKRGVKETAGVYVRFEAARSADAPGVFLH